MAAGICLMKETADKFIQAVKDGKIDPGKLADMSSAERNAFFQEIVGKNHATAVNSLFESKLLLKNQQRGLVTWAKQVSGIKPAARRDLIAKIERMQTVLDPGERKQFMHDLTATRLGVDVTQEEAKNIADLSKKVTEAQSLQKTDKTFPTNEDRMKYGRAVEDLTDYVSKLKQDAEKFRLTDFKSTTPSAKAGLLTKFVSKVAGNMKSLTASMDNSAIFHQGWKPLFTNPKIWAKNAAGTFTTIAKEIGGKNVLREVNADIISRPNYDMYVKGGLAIKNPEEAFPESLAGKVPGLRRLYNASEAAFTGFQYKMRADVADKMLEVAKAKGVDLSDTNELKAIMSVVNSLTGRGGLGSLEKNANWINNVFFSPRYLKSQIDLFTQPFGKGGAKSAFAQSIARKNFIKVVGGTFAVLAAADAIAPGTVEWDPRSTDFGKLKVGDTRFDLTGGLAPLITLAAREVNGQSKSSTTGRMTSLTKGGFGAVTRLDEVVSFFENRASPAAGIIRDFGKGTTPSGGKTTLPSELENSLTPLGIQNFVQLKNDPNAANAFWGAVADGLGINANNYSPAGGGKGQTSWSQSTSKELVQFKTAVGANKFDQAAQQYDNQYNAWINAVKQNPTYQKLSTDDKQKLITKKKNMLKTAIFKANGFKYTKTKSTINKSLL